MTEPSLVARFHVKGDPLPKRRARIGARGGWTPEATRGHEAKIAWAFAQQCRGYEPTLNARFRVMLAFRVVNRYRTDIDNLAKLVLDSLNKLAWQDDWQVDELSIRRVWADDQPSTTIEIYELRNE